MKNKSIMTMLQEVSARAPGLLHACIVPARWEEAGSIESYGEKFTMALSKGVEDGHETISNRFFTVRPFPLASGKSTRLASRLHSFSKEFCSPLSCY
jgi:hypothetical protein